MRTLEPFRDPSCMFVKAPEAHGRSLMVRERVFEIAQDSGSIPRVPHIHPNRCRCFVKSGIAGPRVDKAYADYSKMEAGQNYQGGVPCPIHRLLEPYPHLEVQRPSP